MFERHWWQKPNLRRDEERDAHRAVTWLELFFDLVFVVVISRLAHNLYQDNSIQGTVDFILMFLPVFWVWNGMTYYTERFESDGIEARIYTFLTMIPVSGMAIYSHGGLSENYLGFALSYVLSRSVNIFMWLRAGRHVEAFAAISRIFSQGFFVVVSVICLSFLLPPPYRQWLWVSAVAVDIVTPYFTMSHQAALPKLSTSKFPERFGLLTIIVLGESIIGVINGMSDLHHLSVRMIFLGIIGLWLGFSLWWIYFDFVARRPPKAVIVVALFWVYLHIFLLTSITICGVAVSGMISNELKGLYNVNFQVLLIGSVASFLAFTGLLEKTLRRKDNEPTHHLVSPMLKISSGFLLSGLLLFVPVTPVILMFSCAAGIFVNQLYGVLLWIRRTDVKTPTEAKAATPAEASADTR